MIALAMCLLACTSLSAQGQNERGPEGRRAPRGGFMNDISGITEEQKTKVHELQTQQREEMRKMDEQYHQEFRKLVAELRENQQKYRKEAQEKIEQGMEKILTADQFAAYKQKQEETEKMRPERRNEGRFSPGDRPDPRRGGREFTMHRPGQGRMNAPAPHGKMGRPEQSGKDAKGEQPRMHRRGPRPEQNESSAEANS